MTSWDLGLGTWTVLAWLSAAFALLPLAIGLANLATRGPGGFRRPGADCRPPAGTRVSILIPARDEAPGIEAAVRAALASRGVDVEVVVLDDGSVDGTAAIVRALAERDRRVRLVEGVALPTGWAGKQHACWQLAAAARSEVLMFVDADVALRPDAAARAAGLLLEDPRLGLVSGFPRQRAGTLGERLVVPWIHLLLVGYLPMAAMRRSPDVAFGAGCGQWMVARADAYAAAGGHGADPRSRHDGLALPRAFRRSGWRTDLFDGSALAACRMYDGFAAVWRGFGKSAGEGMATPRGFPVWVLLIGLGHVAPWLLLAAAAASGSLALAVPAALGVAAGAGLHTAVTARVGGAPAGVVLHPAGALLVLAIQGSALARHLLGRPSQWKGRHYAPIGSEARHGAREEGSMSS